MVLCLPEQFFARYISSSSGDDELGDGRADRARRVPCQGTRVRRACRTDARSLHQERATRNSAEVAAHGCSRRKTCALGRLAPPPWPVCRAFSIPGASRPAGFAMLDMTASLGATSGAVVGGGQRAGGAYGSSAARE